MAVLKDARVIAIGGAAIALTGGLGAAWLELSRGHAPAGPPPASQGGLVVVSGRDDDAKLDPKRPLRCFVGGQFVGEMPLAACARRNGVATDALDVGLDRAGALAATNGAGNEITPLPSDRPPPDGPLAAAGPAPSEAAVAAQAEVATPTQSPSPQCWRYGAGGWRAASAPASLPACVSALFAGRCPGPDDPPLYGRWGDQTLRLTGGRVEISADGRAYASFVDPWPPCESAE
jgi:hypothetical protein